MADFQTESRGVLTELQGVVDRLTDIRDADPAKLMTEFSQKIDRIMGAAKTLHMMEPTHKGLDMISRISDLCKTIGYRAAESPTRKELAPVLASFFEDVLEAFVALFDVLTDREQCGQIAEGFTKTLNSRLAWLANRMNS